jgi:hypothetical protein
MKKIALLSAALFICVSALFAGTVNIRDARLAGKNFYYERINEYTNTPYASITITGELVEKANGEPVYYAFNFNDDKGFVLVSADESSWPVIGYAFKGTYSDENLPEHFSTWMQHYIDQITAARAQSIAADEPTRAEWARLLNSGSTQLFDLRGNNDVAPLITNDWNQDFPFNGMCPEDNCGGSYFNRVPVGCVATAMTMIMYYWRWPETGQGSHCIYPTPSYGPQCADFANTTYDWNGMDNLGKNGSSFRESAPLATLSWHGGIAVDMDYACAGSGSYTASAASALKTYFKYATATSYVQKISYSSSAWYQLLRDNLDAGRPLEYGGQGPDGGHAWVCDGYQGTDYFHMNWGWGGAYNGYFYLNNLNPGGSTFNSSQGAIINLQPNTSLYPPYCSGQTTVSSTDFGSIADGSGPVAAYQDNANCSWLIMPDDSVQSIVLSFSRFDLAANDFVTVYDGSTTAAPVLGQFTGSTLPGNVTSTGPTMLVTFVTDGSGTAGGFQADYETNLVSFCTTSTNLTETTGNFDDGSGRFDYRNSGLCKWYLKPVDAGTVTVSFNDFHTEQDKDIVSIYDLGGGTLLESYSGDYTTPPAPVTSNSGQMLLIFNTNSTVRGAGWSASYSSTVGVPEIQGVDQISIYPNPATSVLNLSFNVTEMQSVNIELVAMNGKTLFSENLGNFKGLYEKSLDVSGYAKGVYLLKMTGDKGISMKKVVVQ